VLYQLTRWRADRSLPPRSVQGCGTAGAAAPERGPASPDHPRALHGRGPNLVGHRGAHDPPAPLGGELRCHACDRACVASPTGGPQVGLPRPVLARSPADPCADQDPYRADSTWRQFLRTQASTMLAVDFFHVDSRGDPPAPVLLLRHGGQLPLRAHRRGELTPRRALDRAADPEPLMDLGDHAAQFRS